MEPEASKTIMASSVQGVGSSCAAVAKEAEAANRAAPTNAPTQVFGMNVFMARNSSLKRLVS